MSINLNYSHLNFNKIHKILMLNFYKLNIYKKQIQVFKILKNRMFQNQQIAQQVLWYFKMHNLLKLNFTNFRFYLNFFSNKLNLKL